MSKRSSLLDVSVSRNPTTVRGDVPLGGAPPAAAGRTTPCSTSSSTVAGEAHYFLIL
jgi:hypothetical protein